MTESNFLELEHHWQHVIHFLGTVSHKSFDPDHYRVACIDLAFPGNGDVVGTGATMLYIARDNANHFVPLIPHHVACPGRPARS